MKNVLVYGPGSIYSNDVYIGETRVTTIVINTTPKNTSDKEWFESAYDGSADFAEKPNKHKKGKKLKCWDNKRFYE